MSGSISFIKVSNELSMSDTNYIHCDKAPNNIICVIISNKKPKTKEHRKKIFRIMQKAKNQLSNFTPGELGATSPRGLQGVGGEMCRRTLAAAPSC